MSKIDDSHPFNVLAGLQDIWRPSMSVKLGASFAKDPLHSCAGEYRFNIMLHRLKINMLAHSVYVD